MELLLQRAGLTISGRTLIVPFAAMRMLVLVFHDASTLRRLVGLSAPLADIRKTLPPAERYFTVHGLSPCKIRP